MVTELKLPNNYRLIEEEEMMYTEGGYYATYQWWGVSHNFSREDCANIAWGSGMVAFLPGVVTTIIGAVGYGVFGWGANHGGVVIHQNWTGGFYPEFR